MTIGKENSGIVGISPQLQMLATIHPADTFFSFFKQVEKRDYVLRQKLHFYDS